MTAVRMRLLLGVLVLALVASPVHGQIVGPNVVVSAPPCGKLDNDPSVAVQGSHLLAGWRTGCYPPRVRASASRDGGATWQDASAIPWDGIVNWPIALCAGDSGRFYVLAPTLNFGFGNTLEAHEGRFVGVTFQWRRLTNPVPTPYADGGFLSDPDVLRILFDPVSHNLYVAFTHVKEFSTHKEHRINFVRSTDGGERWEPAVVLTGPGSNGGRIVLGPAGELSVVWENYVLGKLMGRRSDDFGASFGPEFELGPIRDNVAIEPGSWYGNYSHQHPSYPLGACMQAPAAFALAVDRSPGPHCGTWYLATAEYATGTVGPRTAVRGEIEPNEGFAAATPIAIGEDVVGTTTVSEESADLDRFTFAGEAGRTIWMSGSFFASGPSQVGIHSFSLACGDDTTTFTSVGCFNTAADGTAPAAIYTLPYTGRYYLNPSFRINASITYTLKLRDYAIDPASVARDHRDILLSSSTDGGVTWSPEVRVSDGPARNDDCFPEVAVDGSGRVHVAWYDRRDASECGEQTNTYWAYSDDGGQTFSPGVRVSELGSQSGNGPGDRWQVGDHLGLVAEGEKVHLAWTRIPQGGGGEIMGSTITDLPTSVLVSGLTAEETGGMVGLRWWASDVREVREFRIHRATETSEYEVVGVAPVRGDGEYRWQDESGAPGVRYRYRIEVVRLDGPSLWEGPVVATIPAPTVRLAWRGAVPNPFADTVELVLETPDRVLTRVSVYDVTGHEVAKLGAEPEGNRTLVRWNGRDTHGRVVAPGVYLVRAQLGARTVVRQVVRMK